MTIRLQQLVAGWQGADRNQPLSDLYNECLNATGPGGRHLLPVRLLLVQDLDETRLQAVLNGRVRGTQLRFKVKPVGRFDSVLVPTGSIGEAPMGWLLAIEEQLSIHDQVALYAHALGHLLLNNDLVKMGRLPDPDPRDGYAHSDMLAELRMLETIRQPLDRRVLETYPLLAELLGVRDEPTAVLDAIAQELRPRLAQFGWRGKTLVEAPYIFTHGRVSIRETASRRGKKLRIDALLRAEASLPIAVVQTIHAGEAREEVLRRLKEYAHNRLALPFAYLFDNDGKIHEFDWTKTEEPVHTVLSELPSREAMWNRWTEALGLTDKQAQVALQTPYRLSNHKLRYYQETAINRAVIAVLQAKRGLRKPRILLTLATGTGKTKIAFQLVWKLKRARAIRNVLYLTDRDWLLSQAMDNEFAPFGDARQRILGEAKTSRDIVFATYQAIADSETRAGLYHDFPRDFFDVIIVDECHRGSAQDDSRWRTILEYFASAVQIGMTATPLSTEAVQTDAYFGKPIYTYSLRTGINDGFLAPYRVRRVLMGEKLENEQGEQPAEAGIPTMQDGQNAAVEAVAGVGEVAGATGSDEDDHRQLDPILEETSATLRMRTKAIARHLAAYMRQSDPLAKTIVFCVDQEHAEKMREALEGACAEQVARYRDYIERIVSEEGIEGKRALGRFSTPDERIPVIVTTSRLLSTGVDVPTCKNIVLARPVGSLVEFKQIIGRGSRLYEPEKTWFTIIDYAGAIRLFFDPNFDGDPELVEVEPLVPQTQSPAEETGVATGMPATPVVKEDTVSSSEGQHVVKVPVPLLPDTLAFLTGAEASSYAPEVAEPATPSTPVELETPAVMMDTPEALPQFSGTAAAPALVPLAAPVEGSIGTLVPAQASGQPLVVRQTRSGRTIEVIGEYVYELGADGSTLIRRSSYRDYTAETLKEIVSAPEDLRTRWLSREQREALLGRLAEEGVDVQALAAALHHTDVDPFDLLLHVAFEQPMLTRNDRVRRLYDEHKDFFDSYKPQARNVLIDIVGKYVRGEAPDVSDTELLKVPPLSDQGTFVELAQRFGGGAALRSTLKQLQQLLYSA